MELDLNRTGVINSEKVSDLRREMIPDLFPPCVDRSVYHYTSIGGVSGVLQGKLWFTNIRYMNDREEVKVGIEEFRKTYLHDYPDDWKRLLERDIERTRTSHTFVCCFSLDRDSLALWNYYTKDINNKGFNLGFDYKSLIISILQKNPELDGCKFLFGSVDYTNKEETYAHLAEKQLADNLTGALDGLLNAVRLLKGEEPAVPYSHNPPDFPVKKYAGEKPAFESVISSDAAFFMKRPCFSIEQEFRLVIQVPETVLDKLKKSKNKKYKFRIGNGVLIPYLDLDFDLSCLTGIMFSPTVNDELAKDSIIDYCHYCGINPSALPEGVEKSSVPVRY